MKHTKVQSSNIHSIGYSEAERTMEITFKNRKGQLITYSYTPITLMGYKLMMDSESKGKFFVDHIKNNPLLEVKKLGA